jgi:hypothetical protein
MFTVRSAVVLILGLLCGGAVAGLSVLAKTPPATAALVGVAAVGAAVAFFQKTLG